LSFFRIFPIFSLFSSVFFISFPSFLPYFLYLFTIQLAFLPYFSYPFTLQLTFLPYFPAFYYANGICIHKINSNWNLCYMIRYLWNKYYDGTSILWHHPLSSTVVPPLIRPLPPNATIHPF
jgi:hypothetical protein